MNIYFRDDDGFVIPELPYGRELMINIKTTWGDKHYVGLTGIDIFAMSGEQVTVTKVMILFHLFKLIKDMNLIFLMFVKVSKP